MSEAYTAENKGPNIMLTICVIVGISTLFVAARLFVQIKILGQTHLDDHLTVLSLLSHGWSRNMGHSMR
ncbi:integral membrane protein [Colletotrichum higginsianum]|nr:integral membrane protein [Colletotrichum higginsianum]